MSTYLSTCLSVWGYWKHKLTLLFRFLSFFLLFPCLSMYLYQYFFNLSSCIYLSVSVYSGALQTNSLTYPTFYLFFTFCQLHLSTSILSIFRGSTALSYYLSFSLSMCIYLYISVQDRCVHELLALLSSHCMTQGSNLCSVLRVIFPVDVYQDRLLPPRERYLPGAVREQGRGGEGESGRERERKWERGRGRVRLGGVGI